MSWQKVSRVNSERGREDKWRVTNVFQEEIIGKICSFQKYSYFCPTPVSPIAGWRERHILEDVFHAFIFYLLNLATSTREDNSNKGVCVVWLYTYADQAGMFFVCLWVCYISYRRGLTGVAYPRVGQCESLRGRISKNQIPHVFSYKAL